jgi:hypothetical protein
MTYKKMLLLALACAALIAAAEAQPKADVLVPRGDLPAQARALIEVAPRNATVQFYATCKHGAPVDRKCPSGVDLGTITNLPDGSTLTAYLNGTNVTVATDGTIRTFYPDGSNVLLLPGGRTRTTHPEVWVYPDGSTRTYPYPQPDGSKYVETNPDGTYKYTITSTSTITDTTHTVTTITDYPDGKRVTETDNYTDGTSVTVTVYPDGSTTTE